jgi:predicted deacylase
LNNGILQIYPNPNPFGIYKNTRYQNKLFNRDINRNFNDEGKCPVSKFILENIKNYSANDIIVDLHEGYDFHKINNRSLGSTISPTKTELSIYLSKMMINKLNSRTEEDYRKFSLLMDHLIINPHKIV